MAKQKLKNLSSLDMTALYTIDELCPILRASAQTLRRYCARKILPNAIKIGGKNWLIPGMDVLALCPHLREHLIELAARLGKPRPF